MFRVANQIPLRSHKNPRRGIDLYLCHRMSSDGGSNSCCDLAARADTQLDWPVISDEITYDSLNTGEISWVINPAWDYPGPNNLQYRPEIYRLRHLDSRDFVFCDYQDSDPHVLFAMSQEQFQYLSEHLAKGAVGWTMQRWEKTELWKQKHFFIREEDGFDYWEPNKVLVDMHWGFVRHYCWLLESKVEKLEESLEAHRMELEQRRQEFWDAEAARPKCCLEKFWRTVIFRPFWGQRIVLGKRACNTLGQENCFEDNRMRNARIMYQEEIKNVHWKRSPGAIDSAEETQGSIKNLVSPLPWFWQTPTSFEWWAAAKIILQDYSCIT